MKFLLSEAGQCIIFGVLYIFVVAGFYEILMTVTG